jgi:hypothetical protein
MLVFGFLHVSPLVPGGANFRKNDFNQVLLLKFIFF